MAPIQKPPKCSPSSSPHTHQPQDPLPATTSGTVSTPTLQNNSSPDITPCPKSDQPVLPSQPESEQQPVAEDKMSLKEAYSILSDLESEVHWSLKTKLQKLKTNLSTYSGSISSSFIRKLQDAKNHSYDTGRCEWRLDEAIDWLEVVIADEERKQAEMRAISQQHKKNH